MHAEHAARCARDEPEHEAAACHEAEHERKDEIVAGARRDDARLVRVRLRVRVRVRVRVRGRGRGRGRVRVRVRPYTARLDAEA